MKAMFRKREERRDIYLALWRNISFRSPKSSPNLALMKIQEPFFTNSSSRIFIKMRHTLKDWGPKKTQYLRLYSWVTGKQDGYLEFLRKGAILTLKHGWKAILMRDIDYK